MVRRGQRHFFRLRWRTKRVEILPIEGAKRVLDSGAKAGDAPLHRVADQRDPNASSQDQLRSANCTGAARMFAAVNCNLLG